MKVVHTAKALTCATLMTTTALAAAAPEPTLEEVSVVGEQKSYFEKARQTALKMSADDMETPFSTSVINAAILEDLKANTLEDAYSYISGFSRSGTSANSFSIRGLSADLQNIQVDGLPGLVSRFGSPVTANVERVEVLKGPASVLYGWMDPGGMMNIITKKPTREAQYSVDLTAQQFTDQGESGYEGSVDLAGPLSRDGDIAYRLIIGAEQEDSFRDHVEEETLYIFPSITWQVSDETQLGAQFEYTKEERSGDDGLFVANHDIKTAANIETYYQEPGDSDTDEGYSLSLSLNHRFNDQLTSTVKLRSVWHEDQRKLYESNAVIQADDVADTNLRRRNRNQYNEREYHFIDANLVYTFGETITHETLIGINGGYEYRQYDRLAFDTRGALINIYNPQYTGAILADDPQSFRQWNIYNTGVYAFDKISLNKHWTVIAGLRADYQEGDYELSYLDRDTQVSESSHTFSTTHNVGVVYQFDERVSLYGSYAQSFNPQSIAKYDIDGNQLDAEEGEQIEVGAKFSLLDNRLNLNISYFDVLKSNISEENPDTGFDEVAGEISSEGVDINLQYQPTETFQFQVGYTYTDAQVSESYNDDAQGNVPAFAPKHNAFFFGRYNYPQEVLGGFVGASLGLKYESERYTDDELSKRVLIPSYQLVDAGLFYEVENIKYALNLSNLTNEEYYVGGTNDYKIYPGEPRKVSLSLKYDF